MKYDSNNCNYFSQNRLTKFTACSLNNKSKQGWRNKFKRISTNNLRANRAKFFGTVVRRVVTLTLKKIPAGVKLANSFVLPFKYSLECMGLQVICERSEQKKMELLYAEFSHSVPCVSKKFASKNIPQFSIFYFPQLFQEPFVSTCQWSGRPCCLWNNILHLGNLGSENAPHIKIGWACEKWV